MRTHIDLFSGIGGFALACRWAGIKTVAFCEIDEYAKKVLQKNFPEVPIYGDIRNVSGEMIWRECVQTAKSGKSHREDRTACHAETREPMHGENGTRKSETPWTGKEIEPRRFLSSTITAGNAPAVENLQSSFLPLITNTTTETANEENISPRHGNSSLSEAIQTITKSSATTATTPERTTEEYAHTRNEGWCFLLTAGTPCQPASCAGKQRGRADDRWLWGETLRLLAEVRPTWAIFENVPGLLNLESGLAFEHLLLDMEGEGYTVQPLIIPACAVDAPHRRDRVWIVAHGNGNNERTREKSRQSEGDTAGECLGYGRQDVADADATRLQERQGNTGMAGGQAGRNEREAIADGCRWLPEPPVCELADGLPNGLVRYAGRVATKVPSRVQKLKALGNAIVPQVAFEIIKAIVELEGRE